MAIGSVLAFWAVSLLLIVVPGADWAFTIGAGLHGRSVVPAVGGLVTGYAVLTVVVAAGAGALVAGSPAVLTGLTLAGGGYLVWHRARTLTRPSMPGAVADTGAGRATFVRGVCVSGLNPKGLLLLLALLPQFTDPHARWPVAAQIGVLGLAFTASVAVFYLSIGCLAGSVLRARPSLARLAGRISGAAMIAIGVGLVVDRLI